MDLFCVSCNNNYITRVGEIPLSNLFAGGRIDHLLPSGTLYRCEVCHLYFRWPRLSKAKLDKLYEGGSSNIWQYEPRGRNDWKLAGAWLNSKLGPRTVLDVGCWDGGFLNYLGDDWQRYGIEINELAARKAEEKGVHIIGENFDKLDQISTQFDAVVSFDVIEHTENPRHFLEQMARVTRTDGFIIISSGNTEAPTWKIGRSRYWYCAIPEHISFINMAWCYFAADELNLGIEYIKRFSHAKKSSLALKILDLGKNTTYLIAPALFGKLRRIEHHYLHKNDVGNICDYPPYWMTSKDHLIIIFKKNR